MTASLDGWALARTELSKVIDEYEAGNTEIRELAAEAWSSRGLLGISLPDADQADLRRAVSDLNRAIELATSTARSYLWYGFLGAAHCRLGEFDAAIAAYDTALEQSPDDLARSEYSDARMRVAASDPAAC
jgi:tetratricopeptide (TPR) repeat protein